MSPPIRPLLTQPPRTGPTRRDGAEVWRDQTDDLVVDHEREPRCIRLAVSAPAHWTIALRRRILRAAEPDRGASMGIAVNTLALESRGEIVTFVCDACGHEQCVQVAVVGAGVDSLLNSPGTAARRASRDAAAEIDRAMARARCPRCGRRERSGLLRWFATWGGAAMFVSALLVACFDGPTWAGVNMRDGDLALLRGMLPFFLVPSLFVLAVFAIREWRGWSRQLTWLDVEPGPGIRPR